MNMLLVCGVASIVFGLIRFAWGLRSRPRNYSAAVGLGFASAGASVVADETLRGAAAPIVSIVFLGAACFWFGFAVVLMRRERRAAAR